MKELFKKIDGLKNYIIDLQTGMTACPAVSPHVEGGLGEHAKAEFLEKELKNLKADEIKHLNAPDKKAKGGYRPNIAAKFYGEDKTKTFWIMGHMDVVPPGDIKLWNTDPFKAVVKGDKIYGRGTEDNQQAIASTLAVVKAFKDAGRKFPINLGVLLVADEEIGSVYGAGYLAQKHKNIFGKKDFFLVPDDGSKKGDGAEIAEKSILWLKFTVHGKQCHGAMPAMGNNAARAGMHLALMLDEALHKKFNKKDKMFSPSESTFEPTKKEANVPNINTIPGTDVFYFDCRYLPCYKEAAVMGVIKDCVKKIEKQFKVKVDIGVEQNQSSVPTSKDAPIVKLFASAVKEVNKVPVHLHGIGGGTVAAFLRNMGFDAVVCGKQDGTLHGPNEYSSIKNTLDDAKVFAHILLNAK